MKRRTFLAGAAALGATPAIAQTTAPTVPAAATPATPTTAPSVTPPAAEPAVPPPHPMGKIIKVKLVTGQGDIVLELYPDKAPITVANWLRYVDQKRFDGSTFYRAMRAAWAMDTGVIQGGIDTDVTKLLPPVRHEPTTLTGIKHLDGVISMARNAPGTATANYFICIGEQAYLDADPEKPENLGYAAFGKVIEGMDVAKKILVQPTSPTLGVGVMKGQMLMPRVPIRTARRV